MGDDQIDFPGQRKPTILVCGATGSGKTTTINTLFGSDIGEVGHYARGTAADNVYEWEARGRNIDVVDLPGLGDSKDRDRDYRDIYRRRVEKAHAFIVVTTPPRPASLPTLRTVKLLLSCGVPATQLVVAYNRMGLLNVTMDDELTPVVIDGLGGPAFEEERAAIEHARAALLRDLRAGTGNSSFTLDQIVAYDALTGWNLFGILDRVVVSLPGDTLVPWRNAVSSAAERARERQEKRSARDEARIRELEANLAAERARSGSIEKRIKDLEKKKKRAKINKGGGEILVRAEAAHTKGIADRAADWLDRNDLPGGKTIRRIKGFFA